MKLISRFSLLLLLVVTTACTHAVHQYQAGDRLPNSGFTKVQRVESQSEQFVIFWFKFDTEYVNQAYNDLASKCPRGNLASIDTRYSTSHGFFSWTNTIKMTGYCYE